MHSEEDSYHLEQPNQSADKKLRRQGFLRVAPLSVNEAQYQLS